MKDLDELLGSEDAEARRQGVSLLVERNPERRAQRLVTALGDADWRVRKEAVRVASEVGEGWGLLPDLVDAVCQGDNVGLRNAALEVLERLGPRAANALLVALPRVPQSARKFLVTALGFAGGAGVDRLAEIANDDSDPNTAQSALEALARIGGPRAQEALRAHLASEQPVQRLAALEGLERLGADVAVDALRPLLEDRLMRRLALGLLGYSEDPAAADVLAEALGDASSATSGEAARALGRILARGGAASERIEARAASFGPDVLRALRAFVQEGPEDARRDAAWLLLLARDPEAAGAIARLAADDLLPRSALEAVRRWGTDAIEPFLHIQGELPPRARAAALEIAAELTRETDAQDGYGEALRAALRAALTSVEPALVTAAARGLAELAQGEDAAALVDVARRVDAAREAAGRALEQLALREPEVVGPALEGVPLDGPAGAALLPAVAICGGEAAFDRLSEALNAEDPRARRAALVAIPRLGHERAAELAGFALADEDVDVQVAAVGVLAGMAKQGHGVEQLRLALKATAEPVAAAAARALGRFHDRDSSRPLRDLVSEGRPGVAVAALEALRAMNDDTLDELLVEALGRNDVELVKEALRAIAQTDTPRRGARIALALEHHAWDVRQLAARLLGELGGEDVRRSLEARAGREQDEVVMAAIARALGTSEGDA